MEAYHARAAARETGESVYAVRMQVGAHVLTGDEPVEAGGGGLGPAPYELLSAALAECTAMTLRWFARQQAWPVESVEVIVNYSKAAPAGGRAPVEVFEKTITIHGSGLTHEQRARLLAVANKCPVQRTLESTPTITTAM
ncbi:OsmC family protein [Brevundimonas diminuta]|uniref:OsmC family protein n=1 Tax=Brevundimonas TaxID=41275 RepID=UPI000FACEC1E